MTEKELYHKNMLELGLEYQDNVAKYMMKYHHMPIVYYTSYKEQWRGESLNGIEVKFDARSTETGNIFMLTKIKNKSGVWQKSGIYKEDNTIWFIIGNHNEAWMVSKHILLQIVKTCHEVENNTGECMGYLIPRAKMDKIRCIKLDFINNPV